ncbi:GGDEF domain-containing protein [Kineosporia sp. A_224]|uniref:GGDEF domain-containing protein n=1 Tax=Kineosporia sp. A_224 TaxID=1962180 RepID=UPI000B4ADACE|nr:GGDEF domain-containing protein [Kineosporia sp. A_224]
MGGSRDGRPAALLLGLVVALAVPMAVAPSSGVANAAYLVGLTLVVAAVWWGARQRVPGRRSWVLVALVATCWLAGDTVQRVLGAFGVPDDTVGLPDVFWLASYPLLAAAVVSMIRARGLPRSVVREIRLDVLVVAGGAAIAAYHLLVQPNLGTGQPILFFLVGTLYPLGDVVVFGLALTLVMAPGRRGAATALFVGCLGLTLPLDFVIALLPTVAPHLDTSRLDGALLVVNGLLAAAAVHPGRAELTEAVPGLAGHGMRRWRIVLLGTSLTGVTVASAFPGVGAQDVVPTVCAAVVVSLTVVVRFYRAVRDQEVAEAALAHQAHHDQLTGAANRLLLMDRLAGTVGSVDRTAPDVSSTALVFVDLDGFKAVNDRHGHPAGDAVLRCVTTRLRGLVRAGDTVARVGGDEFVLLCHDVAGADAVALGERVVAAVREPFILDGVADGVAGGVPVSVGASVGVLLVGPDAGPRLLVRGGPQAALQAADDLLRRVDTAMYEAKRSGGGVRTAEPVGS